MFEEHERLKDDVGMKGSWRQAVVGRLPEAVLERLRSASALRDIESLFALYVEAGRPVLVWDEQGDDVRADAREGLSQYRRGRTVTLSSLQEVVPEVAEVHRWVRAWLGLTDTEVERVIAFVSPLGSGAAPHADIGNNLSVQLMGRKLWRWSRTTVPSPASVPPTMPEDAYSHVLGPGDCILIPRGIPHQTSSLDGDSLGLSFVFHPRGAAAKAGEAEGSGGSDAA